MTRNQWLILGVLVLCLIVCVGVLSFSLGAYIFQRPNSIVASNPTPESFIPAPMLSATATRPDSAPAPSHVYRLNDVVTDQGWEYTVTKIEKFKTFTTTFPFGTPAPYLPAQGIYIGVYFTLKNISKQNAFLDFRSFEIVDVTGTRYDLLSSFMEGRTTPSPGGCGNPGFPSVPGISSPCKTTFDVNPSATGLKLHLLSSSLYVALE